MMKKLLLNCLALLALATIASAAEKVKFPALFSPSEGAVNAYEAPFRREICLNGLWDIQFAEVPRATSSAKICPYPNCPLPRPTSGRR